jgi:isoleucyl-tRNA synthetase
MSGWQSSSARQKHLMQNSWKKRVGDELIGLGIRAALSVPPYSGAKKTAEAFAKAYKIYAANFVSTEDGTGVVHTAVMYGVDDFELGTKSDFLNSISWTKKENSPKMRRRLKACS